MTDKEIKHRSRCQEIWDKYGKMPPRFLDDGSKNSDYQFISNIRHNRLKPKKNSFFPSLLKEDYSWAFFENNPPKPGREKGLNNAIERCQAIWKKHNGFPALEDKENYAYVCGLRHAKNKYDLGQKTPTRAWFPELMNEKFAKDLFVTTASMKKFFKTSLNKCQEIWDKYGQLPDYEENGKTNKDRIFISSLRSSMGRYSERNWNEALLDQEYSMAFFGPIEAYNQQTEEKSVDYILEVWNKYKRMPTNDTPDELKDRQKILRFVLAAKGEGHRHWFDGFFNHEFSKSFFPINELNTKEFRRKRKLKQDERDDQNCQKIFLRWKGIPRSHLSGELNPEYKFLVDLKLRLEKEPSEIITKNSMYWEIIEAVDPKVVYHQKNADWADPNIIMNDLSTSLKNKVKTNEKSRFTA